MKYVPSQYHNYPVVGGWYGSQDGSYEEFIASEPDIVIESIDEGGDGDASTVKERQENFGKIPVIAVNDTTNVEKVGESITFMGKLLEHRTKQKNSMTSTRNILIWFMTRSSKLSDCNKITVYYAQGDDGLQTTPSHSTHGQLIDLVGGKNVADSVSQGNTTNGVQVSMEQVISWNPDKIVTNDPEFYSKVYQDSNWGEILMRVKNQGSLPVSAISIQMV